MKNKYTLIISLVIIAGTVLLMIYDFLPRPRPTKSENLVYPMDEIRKVPDSVVSHVEFRQISFPAQSFQAICIDENDQIYIAAGAEIYCFAEREFQFKFEVKEALKTITPGDSGQIIGAGQQGIYTYNTNGKELTSWPLPDEKSVITSVVYFQNQTYVADAGLRLVHIFDKNGEILMQLGKKQPEKDFKGFIIPSPSFDILLGREGQLWVVNPGMHQLEAFNRNGEHFSSWQRSSNQIDGFSGCCNPAHIAMLSDGSFVTAEKGLERVKIHAPNGDFKSVVATPDSFDSGTLGLDLAVDSKDNIYILDPVRQKVRIFKPKE